MLALQRRLTFRLVEAKGRVYDPLIGRFMSADPFIQAPDDLQSYNRYAYVMNNPLLYTDPSGYFSWSSFRDKWLKPIVAVAIAYYTGQWTGSSFLGGFAGSAVGAAMNGANFEQSMLAGLKGGLTAAAFTWAGGEYKPGTFGSYAAHSIIGCVSSVANGGQCGAGAAAAVFGKWVTVNTQNLGTGFTQFAVTVTAGGVGSVIGGGKFENGAMTAAYGYLFNQLSSNGKDPNTRGDLGTDNARAYLLAEGYKILGEQVPTVIIGMPLRVYDFVVENPSGVVIGVEVKSSMFDIFKLNSQQVKFDAEVYKEGGAYTNLNNSETGKLFKVTHVMYIGVPAHFPDFWAPAAIADWQTKRLANLLQQYGIETKQINGFWLKK